MTTTAARDRLRHTSNLCIRASTVAPESAPLLHQQCVSATCECDCHQDGHTTAVGTPAHVGTPESVTWPHPKPRVEAEDDETITCGACSRTFRSHRSLETHRSLIHSPGAVAPRPKTPVTESTNHSDTGPNHSDTAARKPRNWERFDPAKCPECGKEFKNAAGLGSHRRYQHTAASGAKIAAAPAPAPEPRTDVEPEPQRGGAGGSESQVAPGLLADEERSAPPAPAEDPPVEHVAVISLVDEHIAKAIEAANEPAPRSEQFRSLIERAAQLLDERVALDAETPETLFRKLGPSDVAAMVQASTVLKAVAICVIDT